MPHYQYHVRIIFESALVMIYKLAILLKVIHASIICQLKLVLNLMKTVHATLQTLSKVTCNPLSMTLASIMLPLMDTHYIYRYSRQLSYACYSTDALTSLFIIPLQKSDKRYCYSSSCAYVNSHASQYTIEIK